MRLFIHFARSEDGDNVHYTLAAALLLMLLPLPCASVTSHRDFLVGARVRVCVKVVVRDYFAIIIFSHTTKTARSSE